MISKKTLVQLMILLFLASADQLTRAETSEETQAARRFELDNGAKLIIAPIRGADGVAVEVVDRVGFLDEPRGATQLSHLLEHVMCKGATATHPAGESFRRLGERGLANAETLPEFTHYDAIVFSSDLEIVFEVEAERLASLRPDRETCADEAARCQAEIDAVLSHPRAPLGKFAVMAAHQAWRYGRREVLVRGDLAEMGSDLVKRFAAERCSPQTRTYIVVGDVEVDRVVALANRTVGAVQGRTVRSLPAIGWERVAARTVVRWDVDRSVVIVGWRPTDSQADRAIGPLWGATVQQALAQDQVIGEVTTSILCAPLAWGMTKLPFLVVATLEAGIEPARAESVILEGLAKLVVEARGPDRATLIRSLAASYLADRISTVEQIELQARSLKAMRGTSLERGRCLALGSIALGFAVRSCLPVDGLNDLKDRSAEAIDLSVGSILGGGRRFVTVLQPMTSAPSDTAPGGSE